MSVTKDKWLRYTQLLQEKLPDFYATLLPPAPEEAIKQIEQDYLSRGVNFPQELKDIYSINGGEDYTKKYQECFGEYSLDTYSSHFLQATHHRLERDYDEDATTSVPPGHVKPLVWCKHWVSFGTHGSGDSLCIDLSPGEKGKVGQIIRYSPDLFDRPVIAGSMNDFLDELCEKLEAEAYVVRSGVGDYYLQYLHVGVTAFEKRLVKDDTVKDYFIWFAFDEAGDMAVLDCTNQGFVPREVQSDFESYDSVVTQLSEFCDQNYEDWIDVISSNGIFLYRYNVSSKHYFRVSVRKRDSKITINKTAITSQLNLPVLPVSFADNEIITLEG